MKPAPTQHFLHGWGMCWDSDIITTGEVISFKNRPAHSNGGILWPACSIMYNSLFIPKEGIITAGRALLRKGKAVGEAEESPVQLTSISKASSAWKCNFFDSSCGIGGEKQFNQISLSVLGTSYESLTTTIWGGERLVISQQKWTLFAQGQVIHQELLWQRSELTRSELSFGWRRWEARGKSHWLLNRMQRREVGAQQPGLNES